MALPRCTSFSKHGRVTGSPAVTVLLSLIVHGRSGRNHKSENTAQPNCLQNSQPQPRSLAATFHWMGRAPRTDILPPENEIRCIFT